MRSVLAVWVAVGCCCGCSSSAYDADYAKRIAAHRTASEFAPLRPQGQQVADGLAELRIPTQFVNQLDGTETPNCATPPFLREFPGFSAAYEALVVVSGTEHRAILTVGAVPAAERRRDEVEASILDQVKAEEGFAKSAWKKGREVVDEDGATRAWDVLELAGKQPFVTRDPSKEDRVEKKLLGVTEIWVSADPKQTACVILAWRMPDDIAGNVPLSTLATLTARTARVPPAKP